MSGPDAAAHAAAVAELRGWVPPDAGQAALRDAYLDFLGEHPDGLARGCDAGHLTAGALVLDPAAGRVLLNLHGKIRRWVQFGGHLEAGDAGLAAAAVRETAEESGLASFTLLPGGPVRLDRHPAPCRFGTPVVGCDHLDVQYAVLAPPDAVAAASAESLDVAWFDWDALPDTDASVRALVALARGRLDDLT